MVDFDNNGEKINSELDADCVMHDGYVVGNNPLGHLSDNPYPCDLWHYSYWRMGFFEARKPKS